MKTADVESCWSVEDRLRMVLMSCVSDDWMNESKGGMEGSVKSSCTLGTST